MTNIIQWNCRGLKINLLELTLLVQSFLPTAFCLQETHLKESDNVSLKGYNMYSTFSKVDERAAGGSSIFVKDNVIHSTVQLTTDLQAVAIRLSLDKTITLCSIYIPPNSIIDKAKLKNLTDQLPSPFILMGDFNAHNPLWGSKSHNIKGKIIEDFVSQEGLCIFNDGSNTYLHPGNGSYSAIDITICDPSLLLDYSWRVHDDLCGSDHFPIVLEHLFTSAQQRVPRLKLDKADWSLFENLCQAELQSKMFETVQDPILTFNTVLTSIADRTIPKTSANPKHPSKPWFDDACDQAIGDRKKSERRFNQQPTTENLSNFRVFRAKARRTCRQARRTSWKKFVSEITSRTPMTKVWNMIQKIKGKNSKATVKHLKNGNDLLTSEKDIANKLGETFAKSSSSNNYREDFKKVKKQKEKIKLNFKSKNGENYNKLFSLEELKTSLSKAHDTACGPDNIHYQLLKHLPDSSLEALLQLMNNIWESGDLPSIWKLATVVPIPKPSKDHTDPINYRPIALTSCVCKTLERMVNDRLVWFLESNGLLANIQCGFRQGRSTLDHLVRFESFVRNGFAKNEHVVSVFFDLEKAYDTAWKYGILKDLFDMGLKGNMPNFISNFLSNRQFNVRVNSTMSDLYDQEMGVPQGSILSVTLFSLKINSLVEVLKSNIEGSLYVDDFLICYRGKNMNNIERQLQLCLGRIEKWASENGFKFSTSKTVGMHFCNKRKLHLDPELTLYGNPIKMVDETKFLGLIFDKKLTFLPHIKMLKSKCLKALDILKVVGSTDWGADRNILLNLYRSLVRSKLDYGSIVYGSARKSYIQILDAVHHQGLRLCLGAFKTSPVESLYVEADEHSLSNRRLKLGLQYAVKLKAYSDNPAYSCVFNPIYEDIFAKHENKIPPLGIRLKPHLASFDLKSVAQVETCKCPPWELPKPKMIFDLREHNKNKTNPLLIQQHYAEIKANYSDFSTVYTDGSKDGDRVASAAVFRDRAATLRLPSDASIFTAEAEAIILALKFIASSDKSKFIICSDSLSCLQAIQNTKIKNPTILKILYVMRNLKILLKEILFLWVPSHVGILGNTAVDLEAKNALGDPLSNCDIPYTDFKSNIREYVFNILKNEWSKKDGNKLHEIKPNLCKPFNNFMCRKDQCVISRCRIGHTRITHEYLLKNEVEPQCIPCNCKYTIKHVLINCIDFADIRKKHFNVNNMYDLFNNVSFTNIVSFLKEVGIYSKI